MINIPRDFCYSCCANYYVLFLNVVFLFLWSFADFYTFYKIRIKYLFHWFFGGRERTLDCKIHWYTKFYNNALSFVGLKTIKCWLVGFKLPSIFNLWWGNFSSISLLPLKNNSTMIINCFIVNFQFLPSVGLNFQIVSDRMNELKDELEKLSKDSASGKCNILN